MTLSIRLAINKLFWLSLLLWPLAGITQSSTEAERVEVRSFEEKNVQRFLEDETFAYDRVRLEKDSNWFERLARWIRSQWEKLFAEDTPVWFRVMMFGLLFLAIVAFFLYMFDVKLRDLWGRSEKKLDLAFEAMPEDIHALDFNQLVGAAIKEGAFRKAVRLLYLESLQELAEKGWIDWQSHKTNYDYQLELVRTPVAGPFAELTLHFEYVWYGGFPIDADHYARIEQIFRDFQNRLQQKA